MAPARGPPAASTRRLLVLLLAAGTMMNVNVQGDDSGAAGMRKLLAPAARSSGSAGTASRTSSTARPSPTSSTTTNKPGPRRRSIRPPPPRPKPKSKPRPKPRPAPKAGPRPRRPPPVGSASGNRRGAGMTGTQISSARDGVEQLPLSPTPAGDEVPAPPPPEAPLGPGPVCSPLLTEEAELWSEDDPTAPLIVGNAQSAFKGWYDAYGIASNCDLAPGQDAGITLSVLQSCSRFYLNIAGALLTSRVAASFACPNAPGGKRATELHTIALRFQPYISSVQASTSLPEPGTCPEVAGGVDGLVPAQQAPPRVNASILANDAFAAWFRSAELATECPEALAATPFFRYPDKLDLDKVAIKVTSLCTGKDSAGQAVYTLALSATFPCAEDSTRTANLSAQAISVVFDPLIWGTIELSADPGDRNPTTVTFSLTPDQWFSQINAIATWAAFITPDDQERVKPNRVPTGEPAGFAPVTLELGSGSAGQAAASRPGKPAGLRGR